MQVKPLATALRGRSVERIESLLSARLFVEPQLVGDTLYFVSNLSGRLSLYSMAAVGDVPVPLLPPQTALQNPELLGGRLFQVLPELDRILVMIDQGGDENYMPNLIPLEGGLAEPVPSEEFDGRRSHLIEVDGDAAYFAVESREESLFYARRLWLGDQTVDDLGESKYGAIPLAWTSDHARVILADEYLMADVVAYELVDGERRILYGTPLEDRTQSEHYPLSGIRSPRVTESGRGLLLVANVFDDAGASAYLDFGRPGELETVAVEGIEHDGVGELERLQHLDGNRFVLHFNIDGCSWSYEARFD
jgi:hypothetical protein